MTLTKKEQGLLKDLQNEEKLCVEKYRKAAENACDAKLQHIFEKIDCPPGSYKPWLARIATNKAKDYLKSAYHRRVSAAEDGEMPAVADVLNAMPPPEDITIAKDEAARIRDTILALKEPYHQVAVLFFLEEKSVDEIASALRRPPKTVHTQIYRAKQLLQNAIERGNGHGIVQ